MNLIDGNEEQRVKVFFNGVAGHIANRRISYESENRTIEGGWEGNLWEGDESEMEIGERVEIASVPSLQVRYQCHNPPHPITKS